MPTTTHSTISAARIYCGTFGKYNSGSIAGAWLDLADYAGRDELLAACFDLHADEADPELMFQDCEGFPSCWYSESSAPPAELWEWLALHHAKRLAFEAYASEKGSSDTCTVDDFGDTYAGTADSPAAFAEQTAQECGELPKDLPSWIVIDWAASWSCNLRHDYYTGTDSEGTLHFFRNS